MTSKAANFYAGVGHLFAWVWMIGSLAAMYFLVTAIFFEGLWSNFFWGLGASIVGKWLSKGFMDNKDRVLREEALVAQGLSKEEAGQKWAAEYTNTEPSYDQIIRDYASFLERNPVTTEVRDVNILPHEKSEILAAIYQGISNTKDKNTVEALKLTALTLAHYQVGVGDQELTQLGLDLSNIDISKLDSDGIKKMASSISRKQNSGRWEEFWSLVEIDTAEISKNLTNCDPTTNR